MILEWHLLVLVRITVYKFILAQNSDILWFIINSGMIDINVVQNSMEAMKKTFRKASI